MLAWVKLSIAKKFFRSCEPRSFKQIHCQGDPNASVNFDAGMLRR